MDEAVRVLREHALAWRGWAAREARVTSSELQQFQHAGTMSGVGAERMASGVAALGQSLRATELRQGGGVAWTLRRLGVEARDRYI